MSKIHFILYERSYCHLCDDMLRDLMALQAPSTEDPGWFSVEQVDVDLIPELTMRYDELVPVLLGRREGQPAIQLCHYFLDRMKVQNFLKSVYDFTART